MKTWRKYFGIMLIILAAICWFTIFLLGNFKLSVAQVSAITAALIIVGEILFWSGSVLVGTELWIKFKKKLNPKYWF